MTAGYVGFDPTADSLHIGNLVPILLLMHLQRAGHKPVALVGGATGMVGDPSGKSEERNMLSEEILQHNVNCVRKQLEQFLDFDPAKPNAAELVNNYDWFKDFTFLRFIREVGKHITVNYMMSKDSVRKRLDGDNGMSFTEFTYQLVQGYDFYYLFDTKGIKLQMGGSDQWGNIVTGTELIRRKSQGEAFAFTCPLITRADGGKFGKSEKGNVWLDPAKTSPYQFYQFWLNTTDVDAEKYIRIFTFLEQAEIEQLLTEHRGQEHKRTLQKTLAKEVTCLVHSQADYDFAVAASELLFQNDTAELLQSLDETQLLQVLDGVPQVDIPRSDLDQQPDIVSFLVQTGVFPSKGEARKMIQNGGISINKIKVQTADEAVSSAQLLRNTYLLVQKGKKNYYLVRAL
jgi:tyrosyl-tRNA synthetase